jgi:hypothetical protein
MSGFGSKLVLLRVFAPAAVAGLIVASGALSAEGDAGKTAAGPPDFSSDSVGWIAQGVNFQLPPHGPRQVTNDPAYPFKPPGRGEAPTFRVADLSNPILQPWAKEELRKRNERIIGGGTGYTRQVSCWPMGTPAFLLYPAQPIFFVQTPDQVLIVSQMDQQVRRVFLNQFHSENVKPSWYGESVGHYEGDTLVVDTIGMNDQTWIDNYRTPHSDKLHTIERFRLVNDGKTLEVNLHVEDPVAFTMPWNAVQRYDRVDQGPLVEFICPENNLNLGDLDPLPVAETPDF